MNTGKNIYIFINVLLLTNAAKVHLTALYFSLLYFSLAASVGHRGVDILAVLFGWNSDLVVLKRKNNEKQKKFDPDEYYKSRQIKDVLSFL